MFFVFFRDCVQIYTGRATVCRGGIKLTSNQRKPDVWRTETDIQSAWKTAIEASLFSQSNDWMLSFQIYIYIYRVHCSSRNRHFETELYRSLKHICKITHNIHKIHRCTCEMFILWHPKDRQLTGILKLPRATPDGAINLSYKSNTVSDAINMCSCARWWWRHATNSRQKDMPTNSEVSRPSE
jgi:hypothetical protein